MADAAVAAGTGAGRNPYTPPVRNLFHARCIATEAGVEIRSRSPRRPSIRTARRNNKASWEINMRNVFVVAGLAAVVATTAGVGVGMASMGTFSAWGHEFTYDSFTPQTVDVTVATEKATGHKMNLVKLKNGHMMALVPADRYLGLMTIPDEDMMK
jgi:hypothetical protein